MSETLANGWFQKHVVDALERIEENFIRLDEKVDVLSVRLARQEERGRVVSGLWGVLGGFLAALGGVVIYFLNA